MLRWSADREQVPVVGAVEAALAVVGEDRRDGNGEPVHRGAAQIGGAVPGGGQPHRGQVGVGR